MAERRSKRPRRSVRFGTSEHEIADETRFHLDRLVEDLVASGATPEEARREAARRFGDRSLIENELATLGRRRHRRARLRVATWTLTDALLRAGRTLKRELGLSLLVIGCLALGTGGPAAIFLLVEGVLLQPLPGIERQSELLKVELEGNASFPTYEDLRDAGVFASTAAYTDTLLGVRRGEQVERALALTVTGSYFPVLGTRAAAGRLLGPNDDRPGASPPAAGRSGGAAPLRRGRGDLAAAGGLTLTTARRPSSTG